MATSKHFTEKEIFSVKNIIVWYLSIWDEIVGDLQEIFISGSSCRILFLDGISICVSLPDKDTLQRLRNSQGKFIKVCRTDIPTTRYLFNFYQGYMPDDHSTSIRHKSEEEIAALKALIGWSAESTKNHGMKRRAWDHPHKNQQQLPDCLGGV